MISGLPPVWPNGTDWPTPACEWAKDESLAMVLINKSIVCNSFYSYTDTVTFHFNCHIQ